MKIYEFLSGIAPARERYAVKIFLVALPLIVLAAGEAITIMVLGKEALNSSIIIFAVVLLVFVAALAIWMLKIYGNLIKPLYMARQALVKYKEDREVPDLPQDFTDEAGLLLADIQATIVKMNTLITEKSDMIDLLSHDLRSPVSRVMSLSNLIKIDDETDKDVYADYITNECAGLLSMLENILMILKEDSQVFTLERVSLSCLVSSTLESYSFTIAEKNLGMDVSVDEGIFIYVQRQLFTQAVRNIIGNAIKFTPDGKVINIAARQDREKVTLIIRDEGLGMKPADIKKIFDRFTTAGKRGTRGEASTGLGLYLSKKIVERHGGTLVANSDGDNLGASFTITLFKLITKKPAEKLVQRPGIKKVVAFHGRG